MPAESCLRFFFSKSGHVSVCFRDAWENVAFAYAKLSEEGTLLFTPYLDLNDEEEEEGSWSPGPALQRLQECVRERPGSFDVDSVLPMLEAEHELDLRIRDAAVRAAVVRLRHALRAALVACGPDGARKAFDLAMIESVMTA